MPYIKYAIVTVESDGHDVSALYRYVLSRNTFLTSLTNEAVTLPVC